MNKFCLKCGCENNVESKFCVRCGARFDDAPQGEEKISAEWQGNDCRYDLGQTRPADPEQSEMTANGTPVTPVPGLASVTPPPFVRAETERQIWLKDAEKRHALQKRKTLFVLSLVGLLLDFLCGIGAFMCLPAGIVSSVELRKLYVKEQKYSAQLLWASIIGYVGAVLGAIFLILMIR